MFKLEPYIKFQLLIVANLYVGQMVVGYGFGFSAPLLLKLKDSGETPLGYIISDQKASWILSLFFIGAIIGPYITAFLSNKSGRKPCLFVGGAVTGIAFLILALAKNVATIYIGRLFSGLGLGILFVVHLVYIGEIASTAIRGIFLTLTGTFFYVGLLSVNAVAPYLTYANTCYLGLLISFLYVCGILFVPETPLYLVMKENNEKAKNVLEILGRQNDYESIILNKEDIVSKTESWTKIFTAKSNRKALIITVSLHILQQISGSGIILSLVTMIFELARTSISSYLSTILFALTQIIASCIAPIFVERSGRRSLLLCSIALCFVSLCLLATYFYLDKIKSPVTSSIDWLPLMSLIMYSMSYSHGFGIIPGTLVGEMYTPKMRSAGATIGLTMGWLCAFVMASIFSYLLQLGTDITFWIFAVFVAAAFVFTLAFVPETKGKTLFEVQEVLKK